MPRKGLLERIQAAQPAAHKSWSEPPSWTTDQAFSQWGWGTGGPDWGYNTTPTHERIENYFEGYVAGAYKGDGIVFAAIDRRQQVFSQARFQWRTFTKGRPGKLFGTPELELLEHPWPNGTTGELLGRMEVDASLAGNFYATTVDEAGRIGRASIGNPGRRIARMRPDWVTLVIDAPSGNYYGIDARIVGYLYQTRGVATGDIPNNASGNAILLLPDECCHFSPRLDPVARFRGMSWLTPIIKEIESDKAATVHKLGFFERAGTPALVVKGIPAANKEEFDRLVTMMEERHAGASNSFRTLYLTAGADATTLGADLKQLDFKTVQSGGEPLALDTPIPTPTGWTTMGAIQVDDEVLGRNGRPARVMGVSPIHEQRQCYRVTLKDRTSIVADATHQWVAIDRGTAKRQERTYTTQEMYDILSKPYPNGVGGHRLSLPLSPILELPELNLLVEPYVLGAWLGDGFTAGAAICGAPEDLKYIAAEIESCGYTVTHWNTRPDRVTVIGLPGGLLAALGVMGVLGNKHIPEAYMRASVGQRLRLLQGLMDTDGTIDDKGCCQFSSKFESLARQVAELARSFGYRATVSSKSDPRSRTGGFWMVHFRVAPDKIPFLLPRKVDRCIAAGHPHRNSRSIVSIEPVDTVPVRCIAVDTDDHLFLAGEGFVPTHNTRISAASGVPAAILGISEGLAGSSLNAGNFGAARRLFVDTTIRDNWAKAAPSLQTLVKPPHSAASLWYDAKDIPFLREDATDDANIRAQEASALRTLTDAGWKPDAAIEFIQTGDIGRLTGQHSGLFSVQLLRPDPGGLVNAAMNGSAPTPPTQVPANTTS
jgi:hypothetical protein